MAKKRTLWITTAAAVVVALTGSAFVVRDANGRIADRHGEG